MSEPLLIHLTLFFSDLTAFSLQLFFTSGFLSWFLRGQVFLNYFRNVSKSCEIFFWVLWEIIFKGMLFIWAAQTLYFFPLLCTTFSCPLLLSFIYGNSEFVNSVICQISQVNSQFFVGFYQLILDLLQRYLLQTSSSLFSHTWIRGVHERVRFPACIAARTSYLCSETGVLFTDTIYPRI